MRQTLVKLAKSTLSAIRVSPEVSQAVRSNTPVVALESTIITHGLPYPQNYELAREVEAVIRDNGAVPATTAFLGGVPVVGVQDSELEQLAQQRTDAIKVSRRDVPYVMSHGLNGGTTIAGTMILAHRVGIRVFATGGLGGVHFGAPQSMDVSADLDELARTPVAVVCSGPKAILDIDMTAEYLETKGVHISTFGPEGTNIPGFFTSDSGTKSPYNFDSAGAAAQILTAIDSLDLGSGTVFCVPPPKELEMPKDLVDKLVRDALKECEQNGISGKLVTPYLLERIWTASKGDSLKTNYALVRNNARMGAQIAVEYARLKVE